MQQLNQKNYKTKHPDSLKNYQDVKNAYIPHI
jgi:hypothetical protein